MDSKLLWPDNICADRHETTGKWVLHYLTDEQATLCNAALQSHPTNIITPEVLDYLGEKLRGAASDCHVDLKIDQQRYIIKAVLLAVGWKEGV